MPFIGNKPSAVPLTSADITDGIITNADISSTAGITLNKISGNPNFRNRIINGDMSIDQRNAGAAVTASDARPVDRFRIQNGSDGSYSAQQDSSAPTGFVNSLKFTTTTADASLAAGQYVMCTQAIEGKNVADLGWGTANAKTITISFYVKSSLTGTFGGALENSANNRAYPFTYSISLANTWEQKTITVAGDTSGTWLTTTGVGIYVRFGLGVGSTFSGTAGAWAGSDLFSATGAVSVIGTLNATWFITGVQLEAGTSATDFEFLPVDVNLTRCQRYFWKTYEIEDAVGSSPKLNSLIGTYTDAATNYAAIQVSHHLNLRATPTVTIYNPHNGTTGQLITDGNAAKTATSESIGSKGGGWIYANNQALGASVSVRAHLTLNSEL